jgi:hypothetical protein
MLRILQEASDDPDAEFLVDDYNSDDDDALHDTNDDGTHKKSRYSSAALLDSDSDSDDDKHALEDEPEVRKVSTDLELNTRCRTLQRTGVDRLHALVSTLCEEVDLLLLENAFAIVAIHERGSQNCVCREPQGIVS